VALKNILPLKPFDGKPFIPETIVTDGGTEFKGVFAKVMSDNDIEHRVAPKNEHSALSIVNALHRTVEKRLGQITTMRGNQDWLTPLQDVIATYNTTEHTTLKASPADVYTGKAEPDNANKRLIPKDLAEAQRKITLGTEVRVLAFAQNQRGITRPRIHEKRWNPTPAIVSGIHRDEDTGLERYRLHWPQTNQDSEAMFYRDELMIVKQPTR